MKIELPVPARVRHNTDTYFLKLIAMLLMVVDHIGILFFPRVRILRIIGRPAFPLFAYCLAAGAVFTHDMRGYARRIAIDALVSQPFYMLAMGRITLSSYFSDGGAVSGIFRFYLDSWKDPSIMLTLAAALLIIWALRGRQHLPALLAFVICVVYTKELDYGYRGVLLCVLFYATIEMRAAGPAVMLLYMLWWALAGTEFSFLGISFGIQGFAIAALPVIYARTHTRIRIPRAVFYVFYPAHLAALYAACLLAGRWRL